MRLYAMFGGEGAGGLIRCHYLPVYLKIQSIKKTKCYYPDPPIGVVINFSSLITPAVYIIL